MSIRLYQFFLMVSALIVTLLTSLAVRFGLGPGIVATLALAVIAFTTVYAIYGFTAQMFARFNESTRRIGQGDLTGSLDRLPAPGEFGQLAENVQKVCKGMIKHLGEIVRNMVVLERNAEQINRGIEHVMLGGRAQAGGIKEIVDLVETYEVRNQASIELSRSAQGLATDTGSCAMQGAEKITCVREMIAQIQDQVKFVEVATDQIGEAVGLISDMSAQTNFLALAAAIEAARAGEYGHGFDAVALQVTSLAEGTGQAASEITALIAGVYRSVADAKQAALDGLESLGRFESSFGDIRIKSQASLDMAQEIGRRLNEQGHTAALVIGNIRSIAAVAGETAATAASIGSVTGEMEKVIDRFRIVADTYRI